VGLPNYPSKPTTCCLVDAAVMLDLLEVEGAQAFLTDAGREWYTGDIQTSKQLVACQALEHAPLVRTIVKTLETPTTMPCAKTSSAT
jgi:hypothetical protein